jgi:hypothetical protein
MVQTSRETGSASGANAVDLEAKVRRLMPRLILVYKKKDFTLFPQIIQMSDNLKMKFIGIHAKYNNSIHDLFEAMDMKVQHRPTREPIEILKEIMDCDVELQEQLRTSN